MESGRGGRDGRGWDAHETQQASGFDPSMLFTALTIAPQGSQNIRKRGKRQLGSYKAHGGDAKESSCPGTQARKEHGTNSLQRDLPGSHAGLPKN